MPIETLYRVQCDRCEEYLREADWTGKTGFSKPLAALHVTHRAADQAAVDAGWCLHPVLCPDCRNTTKERLLP